MNYQNRGLCYLPKPKAEADNTDTNKMDLKNQAGRAKSLSYAKSRPHKAKSDFPAV